MRKFKVLFMNFKCHCNEHFITVKNRIVINKDYIGLTIYEVKSINTGRKLKKLREMGTVVLIGEEAKKFRKYVGGKLEKIRW